ncbi:hypothetical protein C8F04DRAFT_1069062 [Mycena alexandri]|uniref:Uncharacterized protein n=1 Tax=Mycena alexandri TaxID=1745969 RepID=A0AAD6TGB6_9AGAR|nr:hypothetical protein C8F04DRAFT_1069062 [Mycena alexandri]
MKFATAGFFSTLLVSVSCRAIQRRADAAYPADFKPNFSHQNSVTINQPLSVVWPVLGTNEGLGKWILLESIASNFSTQTLDTVNVNGNLEDAVHLAPAAQGGQGFPRQAFTFTETVKIIPGLSFTDIPVQLTGTFTWDATRNVSLYETTNGSGILVKKVRTFSESNGVTTVSEQINGQCPFLEQPIVQLTTTSAHNQQMALYPTLFQ